MKYILSVVTIIGGLIGALLLIISFAMDTYAGQGAFAAAGVGFAVIPYCITRAAELLTGEREELLRSIASEIRRGPIEGQSLIESGPKRTIASPNIGGQKPQTVTHPEKGNTGRRNDPNRRIFQRV